MNYGVKYIINIYLISYTSIFYIDTIPIPEIKRITIIVVGWDIIESIDWKINDYIPAMITIHRLPRYSVSNTVRSAPIVIPNTKDELINAFLEAGSS